MPLFLRQNNHLCAAQINLANYCPPNGKLTLLLVPFGEVVPANNSWSCFLCCFYFLEKWGCRVTRSVIALGMSASAFVREKKKKKRKWPARGTLRRHVSKHGSASKQEAGALNAQLLVGQQVTRGRNAYTKCTVTRLRRLQKCLFVCRLGPHWHLRRTQ